MTTTPPQPRPERTGPVALGNLFDPAAVIPAVGGTDPDAWAGTEVTGVSLDSRQVRPGDLYAALPGMSTHGARFIAQAVAAGAAAVVTDPEGAALVAAPSPVPVVVVPDPRGEVARVAAEVYGRPAEHLLMLGITGTAGKTSTAFLLEAGLAAAGLSVANIGTIGFRLRGEALQAARSTITTPEAPDLHALLAVMLERGAEAVAMEVSSHALALHRVDPIRFDVAGFTNLGHDHLDFHRDQEAYFRAKASLFLGGRTRRAVVNTDDPWGRRLAEELRAEGLASVVTTGGADADYRITSGARGADGSSRLHLVTPGGEHDLSLGLIGAFNAANALTAAAMLDVAGVGLATALAGFAQASVPGRMQRVPLPDGAPNVVLSGYGHTSMSTHSGQLGLRAWHTRRPWNCRR